jgi:hypothetical protein
MLRVLTFLATNLGTLREDKVNTRWGPGIRRTCHLGPLSVVWDIIILYRGGLLHFKYANNCISLTPGWVKGYNARNTERIR